VAIKAAAPGIGRPLKKRLSIVLIWMLKRPRRRAPQTTKRKAAIQPRRPKGSRPRQKQAFPGRPERDHVGQGIELDPETARVLVYRAIFPSNPSRTPATRIKMAAMKKSSWRVRRRERNPQKDSPP